MVRVSVYKNILLVFGLTFLSLFLFSEISYAGGGDSMPYESGLLKLRNSLAGPVGISIAVIAFFVAGAMFAFGGEMTGMMKTLVGVCFAVGIMLGGNAVVTKLFGASATGNLIINQKILSDKIDE